MNQNFWEKIHRTGRSCLHCGFPWSSDSLFCKGCDETLWNRHRTVEAFETEGSPGLSLFSWFPDQDRQLSLLLENLKGGKQQSSFDFYARMFISRLPVQHFDPQKTQLVPCPSRDGKMDHAEAFAQSLSKYLGFPVENALEFSGDTEVQKNKSKADRRNRKLKVKKEFEPKNIIFIDDIVTTGSTAKAARKALTGNRFQVWCLAIRKDF